MGQETLVEEQIRDGKRLVERLSQEGLEVTTSFWLKTSEDSQWYLNIVSPVVETEGIAKAYRRVHTVVRQMEEPFWVDPFEVKLIGPQEPLAVDVLAAQRRHSGKPPLRHNGRPLGGMSVEGAYFYPLETPAAG